VGHLLILQDGQFPLYREGTPPDMTGISPGIDLGHFK
jgi:hypothetical protein